MLIDKLATKMPRNGEIAELRRLADVLEAEQQRKRDWLAIKRRQRARRRQLAVTATQEAVKDTQ
jgi:hypothetical protein